MVPVLLITGFLGSGKTTFINWVLHNFSDKNISLILNEFGSIKLESQFIKEKLNGEVAELSNGCMCCVAKSDIPRVVNYILDTCPNTELLLIEASGLSDPDPIHEAMNNPSIGDKVWLNKIICIVDVVNFEATVREHSIVMSQIGDADLIILNKISLVGNDVVSNIKDTIQSIGVNTKVVEWNDGLLQKLLSENFVSNEVVPHHSVVESNKDEHSHEQYDEFWFTSKSPVTTSEFLNKLRDLPKEIFRSKGYINDSGNKVMIQYVNGEIETYISDWNSTEPQCEVLFIGKEVPKREFEAFIKKIGE